MRDDRRDDWIRAVTDCVCRGWAIVLVLLVLGVDGMLAYSFSSFPLLSLYRVLSSRRACSVVILDPSTQCFAFDTLFSTLPLLLS